MNNTPPTPSVDEQELLRIHCAALIRKVHAFHGQSVYASVETGIARKKIVFRFIFPIVRTLSRVRLGNVAMLVAILFIFRGFYRPERGCKVFEYGQSINNITALKRLNACLPQAVLSDTSLNGQPATFIDRVTTLIELPSVWRAARVLSRRRHSRALPHIQALIAVSALLFYRRHPLPASMKVVCVASDHAPISQALLFLAACSGKKTCYIQHAPVTHHFPPLNYDLAILYDRASAAAYASSAARSCGNARPSIEFLPPFSDGYKRPNVGEPPYTVGICLSFLPDVEALGALIDELASSRFVKGVVLRAHPRCTLDLSKLARAGFAFFQPKSRSAEDFFANVDVVLVPNSGVTIAALHFGCPTYFTPGLDSLPEDYYGFVAQGILPVYRPEIFADCDALLSFFDDGWLSRFSDLDETVNTPVATAQKNVELAFLKLLA